MSTNPGKALGRPCKYKKEHCALLIEHMKQGLSFESFGATVDVDRSTLFEWVKRFPDFKEAKGIGESHSRLIWEKMGMILIARGGGNGSAATYIFNMKNRFGYRDLPKDEGDALPGGAAKTPRVEPKSPETMRELLKIARGEGKK